MEITASGIGWVDTDKGMLLFATCKSCGSSVVLTVDDEHSSKLNVLTTLDISAGCCENPRYYWLKIRRWKDIPKRFNLSGDSLGTWKWKEQVG